MKPIDQQEQQRRIAQSEKDKGFKKLQQQIDELRTELEELKDMLREFLDDNE